MPSDVPTANPVDWDEVEIAFRIGEQTIEEIAVEQRTTIEEIESRAFIGDWYSGWEPEAIHPKYILLVNEFLIDMNGPAAMKRAGITRGNWAVMRQNPTVSALLRKRLKAAAVRANISQDEVLAMWLRIVNADIRKFYDAQGNLLPVDKLDDDSAFALAAIKVVEGKSEDGSTVTYGTKEIKLVDRLKALQHIGDHLGMFNKKVEVTGKDGEALIPKERMPVEEIARHIAWMLQDGVNKLEENTA
jgi:phage terminase small subunit